MGYRHHRNRRPLFVRVIVEGATDPHQLCLNTTRGSQMAEVKIVSLYLFKRCCIVKQQSSPSHPLRPLRPLQSLIQRRFTRSRPVKQDSSSCLQDWPGYNGVLRAFFALPVSHDWQPRWRSTHGPPLEPPKRTVEKCFLAPQI